MKWFSICSLFVLTNGGEYIYMQHSIEKSIQYTYTPYCNQIDKFRMTHNTRHRFSISLTATKFFIIFCIYLVFRVNPYELGIFSVRSVQSK